MKQKYFFVMPDASFAHECNKWLEKLSYVASSGKKDWIPACAGMTRHKP
ncbi:MAG: hypothetical protein ABL857_04570 [Rickettsiales bacterium]|jgi:hypothetical protein